MCRARCITHQGRVLSANGTHNHQPHMKGACPNSEFVQSGNTTTCVTSNGNSISISMRLPSSIPALTSTTQTHSSSSPTSQSSALMPPTTQHQDVPHSQHHLINDCQTHEPPNHTVTTNVHHSPPSHHQHHSHHNDHASSSSHANNNSTSLQNMMQNVLSQNNLMQLTNMTPILNPMQNHSHMAHLTGSHLSNELHAPPSQTHENNENLHSPDSPRASMHHAQLVRHQMSDDVNRMTQHHSHATGAMHGQQPHHHHHQSNENHSPQMETQPHRSQLTPESDSNVHHTLGTEMTTSSPFKLEQI